MLWEIERDILAAVCVACVVWVLVILNKWDSVDRDERNKARQRLARDTTNIAMSFSALREDDLKRYKENLAELQQQLDNANEIIEHLKAENGRMTVLMAATKADGIRGKFNAEQR